MEHGPSLSPNLPPPRLLRLEVAELDRSIAVTRRVVPQVPLLDNDVAALQKVGVGGGCVLGCFGLSLRSAAGRRHGGASEGVDGGVSLCISTRVCVGQG